MDRVLSFIFFRRKTEQRRYRFEDFRASILWEGLHDSIEVVLVAHLRRELLEAGNADGDVIQGRLFLRRRRHQRMTHRQASGDERGKQNISRSDRCAGCDVRGSRHSSGADEQMQ